ncbi:hypothetical protein GY45DRAFT_1265012, partial [Cubamyces sp. BRFM 1775]
LAKDMHRQEGGVRRQNFKYGPSLTQPANMCAIVSPQPHHILTKHMPLPTLWHILYLPQFPLSVCKETFLAVARYLQSVKYSGPVALSCNDPKLHAAF